MNFWHSHLQRWIPASGVSRFFHAPISYLHTVECGYAIVTLCILTRQSHSYPARVTTSAWDIVTRVCPFDFPVKSKLICTLRWNRCPRLKSARDVFTVEKNSLSLSVSAVGEGGGEYRWVLNIPPESEDKRRWGDKVGASIRRIFSPPRVVWILAGVDTSSRRKNFSHKCTLCIYVMHSSDKSRAT